MYILEKNLRGFMKYFFLMITCFFPFFLSAASSKEDKKVDIGQLRYVPKDYSKLLGMAGFSDDLLKMHFTLYQGYVKNVNVILDEISAFDKSGKSRSFDYGAVKRRMGWEYDGMRLHELYFENLGGKGDASQGRDVMNALSEQFGSYEAWLEDFISTGLIRGIGWVILCRDNNTGKLFNIWVSEHDVGHLANASLLLVMDVWEHAYITEYGLNREKYIYAFFSNVDWSVVNNRLKSSFIQKK
jgi:Fe-Mn family superoxide dismutase